MMTIHNNDTNKLPQPRETKNNDPYRYIRYEDIPRIFFPSNAQIPVDQLVWVCKSKGRRRRRQEHNPEDEETQEENAYSIKSCNNDCYCFSSHSSTRHRITTKNRLELFLRARILAPPEDPPLLSSDHHDPQSSSSCLCPDSRIRVQYPLGSTYHVRSDHLIPVLDDQVRRLVIVVDETSHYRKLCVIHTLPHESFLEIGSDLGFNVQRIYDATTTSSTSSTTTTRNNANDDNCNKQEQHRLLVGVDKSAYSIRTSSESFPHLTFVQWDPLEQSTSALWEQLAQKSGSKAGSCTSTSTSTAGPSSLFHPQIIAVDINGSRELPAVLACIDAIWNRHMWEPRLIIVKSRTLYQSLPATTEEACD